MTTHVNTKEKAHKLSELIDTFMQRIPQVTRKW